MAEARPPSAGILALQRSAGNAAVARVVGGAAGARRLQRAPQGGWSLRTLEFMKLHARVDQAVLEAQVAAAEARRIAEEIRGWSNPPNPEKPEKEEKQEKKGKREKRPAKEKPRAGDRSVVERWKNQLLDISDKRLDDAERAWGPGPQDANPLKLRVYAFQRGEQYIHAAAMKLEPDATLEIIYDTESQIELYRAEGAKEGLRGAAAMRATYVRLNRGAEDLSEEEVQIELASRGLWNAMAMRQFLIDTGIEPNRISLCGVKTTRTLKDQYPNRATNIVNEAFRRSPKRTRRAILELLPTSDESKRKVNATIEYSGIQRGEPCVLLWIRGTGRSPGGAPEYDTRTSFARAIIETVHKNFEGRTIALIGDPLPEGALKGMERINVSTKLVRYWTHQNLGYPEQLLFLHTLNEHARCVAVGIESGVLELPALMGMPTIYLEPAKVRYMKGQRWRDFWAHTARTGDPQRRATATMVRLIYKADTEVAALVLTTSDRLRRWRASLKQPGVGERRPRKGPQVTALCKLLAKKPVKAIKIADKWTKIETRLASAMAEVPAGATSTISAEDFARYLAQADAELAAFKLEASELKRLVTLIDVMTKDSGGRLPPEVPSAADLKRVDPLIDILPLPSETDLARGRRPKDDISLKRPYARRSEAQPQDPKPWREETVSSTSPLKKLLADVPAEWSPTTSRDVLTVADVLKALVTQNEARGDFWAAYDHYRTTNESYRYRLSPSDVILKLTGRPPFPSISLTTAEWSMYHEFKKSKAHEFEFTS